MESRKVINFPQHKFDERIKKQTKKQPVNLVDVLPNNRKGLNYRKINN